MGSLLEPSGQVEPGQWELHPSSVEVEANNPYSLESAWPFPKKPTQCGSSQGSSLPPRWLLLGCSLVTAKWRLLLSL